MLGSASTRSVAPGRASLASVRALLLSPAGVAAALTIGFIGVSAWWLSVDSRVPDFDNAKHLLISFAYYDGFHNGDALYWFRSYNEYPPLVHLVGTAAAYLKGGLGTETPTMAQNLVFVPLLAAGCYGTATRAYGQTAAALAVLFALGTPMVISQFHVFMLDAPEAALAAASVWFLLASERFSRVTLTGLAGVAIGAGLLVKTTFVFFVAGVVAVMLLKGGWRNWRGLLVLAVAVLAVAGPWYVEHIDQVRAQTIGATGTPTGAPAANIAPGEVNPKRFSWSNHTWYGWNLLNQQLLLPLALFLVAGTVLALRRLVRDRRDHHHDLELLAGSFTAWFGMTYVTSLHDPRYTLPALVYMAVLGTGWISLVSRRRLAAALIAVLAAIATLNTAMTGFGVADGPLRITLPGAPRDGLHTGELGLYSTEGYVVGGPERGQMPDFFAAVRADGFRVVVMELGPGGLFWNHAGLRVLAREAQVDLVFNDGANLRPGELFVTRRGRWPGDPPPCVGLPELRDGSGLYATRERPPKAPLSRWHLYCPRTI